MELQIKPRQRPCRGLRQRRSSSRHDGNDKRTRAGGERRGRIDAPRIERHKRSDKGHAEAGSPRPPPPIRRAVDAACGKNARTTAAQNAACTTHVSASTATVNHETIAAPSLCRLIVPA